MKRAFICGINAYKEDALKGCVNDASSMYDILTKKFDFDPDNVRMLVDDRATTQAMLDRLDWLVTGLKAGDVAVFHYSGHGSQIRDRNSDELNDHLDEVICPVDLDWDQHFITDDDLAGYMRRVPSGADMYVVLDCCHSGTATREISGGNPHPETYRKSKRIVPPIDVASRAINRTLPVLRLGRGSLPSTAKDASGCTAWWPFRKPEPVAVSVPPVSSMNHLLLAACRSDQTSEDAFIGTSFCGALTYNLVKTLNEYPSKTATEIFGMTKDLVKSSGFEQETQLEGPSRLLDKTIFT